MNNEQELNERNAKLARVKALINDKQHVRKNALRLAGLHLEGLEDEIYDRAIEDIDDDDDVLADGELFDAHEALIEAIAKEVVKIGEELSAQAKQLK